MNFTPQRYLQKTLAIAYNTYNKNIVVVLGDVEKLKTRKTTHFRCLSGFGIVSLVVEKLWKVVENLNC